jgi:CCR4-NOT transcriptional regulation complex NOT5 subunit
MDQTDRFATDLRKELAKLQREREKLRSWLAECRPELESKMESAKKMVEDNMYRYRAFEKAWKHRSGVFTTGDVCCSIPALNSSTFNVHVCNLDCRLVVNAI